MSKAEKEKFADFVELVARLRSPEGCPWDRKQTHKSLRPHFLEECYEVLEALDEGDSKKLCQELGDLLLHIVIQSRIATEAGEFELGDVLDGISKKLIHRHPHVFGSSKVKTPEEALQRWESLKQEERGEDNSLLASVPRDMPALGYSQEIQQRVAKQGFDWPDVDGVIDKLCEEVRELDEAEGQEEKQWEFGDLLFTLANIARRMEIDLETALREANRRFYNRFTRMQELCRERGLDFGKLSFDEQNALWEEAKQYTGK